MTTKLLCNQLYFNRHLLKKISATRTSWKQLSTKETETHSTVDEADVARHTKMMYDWWDVVGPMKALHSLNMLRVPFVRDGIVESSPYENTLKPLMSKKILDVGCGGGILTEGLAKLGAEMTGIDASPHLIEMAQTHSNNNPNLVCNRPVYYCHTIEDHVCQYPNHYDAVVASEVIEHVNNKELFVCSCVGALKPGGRIFFTTPSRTNLTRLFGIYFAEYVLNVIPKGTHQYDKLMTPNELKCLLERNGCHIEATFGIFYHVLTNKWEWVNTKQFMFAMQATKIH